MGKKNEAKTGMTVERKKCFIITPIGDELSSIRRHIEGIIDVAIAPALGDKYDIRVSHRIYEQGMITKQIIKEICNDELIIANITDRNPNVMYELALCHALGKPVIIIAEKNTSLPSDIIMQRTIFYINDAQGVLELREELKKAEKELDFEQQTGPIIDVFKEISRDSIFLEKARTEKGDELGQMEYIISRLNKIEDALTTSKRMEGYTKINRIEHKRLQYKCTSINKVYTPYLLKEKLSMFLHVPFPGVKVVGCVIEPNELSITIDLLLPLSYGLHGIEEEIRSILKRVGMMGAETVIDSYDDGSAIVNI